MSKTDKKKSYKLDIFDLLKHVDRKDTSYYSKLSDEQKKAVAWPVVIRWMSSVSNPYPVYVINEVVNPYIFVKSFYQDHRELLWYLLTISSTGKSQYRQYIKAPARDVSKPISSKVVAQKYKCSLRHASDAVQCLTGNDILDIAEDLGLQRDTLSEIRKEWKGEDLRPDIVGSNKKPPSKQTVEQSFFEF